MISAMESSHSQERSLGAALDPRQRIYRDPFNELVVFVTSAFGAAVLVPVVLLIVATILGGMDLIPFLVASVVLELVLIFGFARPQMKPAERAQWSLLWGFSAAVLGAAFWELVVESVL
jgi:hypothetical protein